MNKKSVKSFLIVALICGGINLNAAPLSDAIETSDNLKNENNLSLYFNEADLGECNRLRYDPKSGLAVIDVTLSSKCPEGFVRQLIEPFGQSIVIDEKDVKYDRYGDWSQGTSLKHDPTGSEIIFTFTPPQLIKINDAITAGLAFNIGLVSANSKWAGGLYNQLSFARLKASYDIKDYSKAFSDAQLLARQGDTSAQLYIGKMYADGRGTIQAITSAHMWFNIASMNGSDEAYEQRKALTAQMSPSAVEKAQAMAMTCIQSAYTDCGLAIKPIASKGEAVAKTITELDSLKSHFKEQSLLKRKQIQYALKKLGLYASSVDGAWGNGTATAVNNYQKVHNLEAASTSELYTSVLAKVEVPSSFSSASTTLPKAKSSQTKRKTKRPLISASSSGFKNPLKPRLHRIMSRCEKGSDFDDFAHCVKNNFERNRGSSSVKSFFIQLRAAQEAYQAGIYTYSRALASAYSSYEATVGADRRAADNYVPYVPPRSTYTPPVRCYTTGRFTQCR